VKRAQDGDASTLPVLKKLLDEPGMPELCGGYLARRAQARLIRLFAGKNLLLAEAIPRKLESLRLELAGPNPAPLERLLVERIVSCWLHLHHLESVYGCGGDMTLSMATHYQRAIQRGQKNYLAAIKALAMIRKLALPALQVNIARRQVNVVNAAGEGAST
jgi:hypothetical protein